METKLSRQLFLIAADILAVNAAFLLTLFLHFEGDIPSEIISIYLSSVFILTVGKLLIYRFFDLYNSLWSYASVEELVKILLAVIVANVFGIIYLIYMGERLYFGIYLTSVLFEIALVSSGRFSYRLVRSLKNRKIFMKQDIEKKILIIGSGATATLIATEIKNHASSY